MVVAIWTPSSGYKLYNKLKHWNNDATAFQLFLPMSAATWNHLLSDLNKNYWDNLFQSFKDRFGLNPAFLTRKQLTCESVHDFITDMRCMATRADQDALFDAVLRGSPAYIRTAALMKEADDRPGRGSQVSQTSLIPAAHSWCTDGFIAGSLNSQGGWTLWWTWTPVKPHKDLDHQVWPSDAQGRPRWHTTEIRKDIPTQDDKDHRPLEVTTINPVMSTNHIIAVISVTIVLLNVVLLPCNATFVIGSSYRPFTLCKM